MLLLVLHIFVICTSLLAWTMLTISGYCLLRHHKDAKTLLFTFIVLALWIITSFNAWYEGVFLLERIALVSTINSWGFTFITPLFYLYYRFCITDIPPTRRKWIQHLLLPGILAMIYIGFAPSTSTTDKLIYTWQELLNHDYTWWTFFRFSCYLSLVAQLIVYLPRLFGRNGVGGKHTQAALRIRQSMKYIICFCLISVAAMLTPFLFSKLIYNLAVTALAGYIFMQLPSYRLLKRKLNFYLAPPIKIHELTEVQQAPVMNSSATTSSVEETIPPTQEDSFILFPPEEEKRVIERLTSPELLHNPNLSISMLARELSTNETYLSRFFNRQLGVSFPEYVSTSRLNIAEKLLKETDATVIEISEQVGFQSVSTFYQAFNARHEMPPSQWRKLC
ncbi:helix-turn-helix transcriptional regulator [Bacteroides sp.]|uniref:helix-turn-helix transcriptional regulator n=1 Tax=Bacteroides sp. TaxID=29523 RepID=UPI0026240C23|nr:helix-turn-helix domain-containing protein [Bacteroides sp.]MDD3038689.1 helix-turn-helix domain-containing protein [Bacteroides sp.]